MAESHQPRQEHKDDKGEGVKLQREINVLHATAAMAGVMIGSGIFVSPVSIIMHCGSVGLSLIIWALVAAITLCIALCYTELAGMFPVAGAEYSYFLNALGRLPAFMSGWVYFMTVQPCFVAILALTTIDYIIYPFFPDCTSSPAAKTLLTVVTVLTIAAINCVHVRYVVRLQSVFMLLKILALCLIIVGGVIHAARGKVDVSVYSFENTTRNPGAVCIAIFSGVFTYAGWNDSLNLMEEVKNPAKVIPKTVFLSISTVAILYILTNVSYFAVMSPETMIASDAVAVTFATRVYGQAGAVIMPLLVASSTFGALNGTLLGGTRKFYAMARDGMFPAIISSLHVYYNIPWISVFAVSGISVIYILSGDAVELIEYLGFVEALVLLTACICVAYLRCKRPKEKRTFRIPIPMAVVAIAVLAAASVLSLIEKPYSNGIGVIMLLSGIPVYCIGVLWNKPEKYNNRINNWYTMLQKTLLVAREGDVTMQQDAEELKSE